MLSGAGVQLSRDLVLLGGGHAHALVLKHWGMDPLPGARLTVVNPGATAPYTGMLPGFVAGHYGREDLEIDLVQLCRHAGARLILDKADGLDLAGKTVSLEGRPPIAYDVLSLDIGIHGALPGIPGLREHGVPAKPLGRLADRWTRFAQEASRGAPATICMVGGGVAGAELALAMAHRLRGAGVAPKITLAERSGAILSGVGAGARRALLAQLDEAQVQIVTHAEVARVRPSSVELANGQTIPARLTVIAAGAVPYAWLEETGLPLHDGSVLIDETLQVAGHADVFAAGDCAHMGFAPRDKAGVYAVRQAPILTENLRAALEGHPPAKTYAPQKHYLKLISTGTKTAAIDKAGFAFHGALAWRLKDTIDRRFMDGLSDLPTMKLQVPSEAAVGALASQALCGGCGAKAGRAALRDALAGLPKPSRADVVRGIGDDAGVLNVGTQTQVITTDTLSGVTDDPYLLGRIAAVHALGDVWAMGAAPQAALATLTLPRMTARLQTRTIAEAMAGVARVMTEAGAEIVGGHTGLGSELSIGLSVTGLADRIVAQDGARAGDALVLTKPLGTGVILAGAMAGLARGDDVAAAWASMARPQGRAAAILSGRANAITDVTGFGLANHLDGLCGDKLAPHLDRSAIPLLDGAASLASAGVCSSLFADNLAALGRPAPDDPRDMLLYDPQTAGGLLAAIPEHARAEIDSLMPAAGEPYWLIGHLEDVQR